MTRSADTASDLADLYAFVSSVLADPPDETAIERLVSEQFPRDASPQSLDNGFRLLDRWGSEVDDPEAAADELRKAHTRLFVGPRPRMQVHESWYADDFLGEPLSAVRSTYQDLGVEESNELREEPDHAAVELAALEMLARDGADGYRQAFLSVHGWWLPELAEDLRELSDNTFYEAIGWLLEGVLEADGYLLSLDLDELSPGYEDGPTTDGTV